MSTNKWHPMNAAAGQHLRQVSSAPTFPISLATNALPVQLQQMPGVVSYFVSYFPTAIPVAGAGVTVGGELVAVRHDAALANAKSYPHTFGTSSNGQVVFSARDRHFVGHHSPISSPAPVAAMFGHVPLSTSRT